MENNQFQSAVKSLISNSIYETDINKLIQKAINSGAIDVQAIDTNDYTQAKALAYVICKSLSENLRPLSKEGKKEVSNLEKFI